eukprot:PhM_4_TR15288/c0_g1_i1/m.14738/K10747/LIG1; DNA ligase 1
MATKRPAPCAESSPVANDDEDYDSEDSVESVPARAVAGPTASNNNKVDIHDVPSTSTKKKRVVGRKLVGGSSTTNTTSLAMLVKNTQYSVTDHPLMTWPEGGDVPYSFLCDALADVSNTSGRLETTIRLANCFWSVLHRSPKDLLACVYLSLNKLAPDQEGVELGVGDATLTKSIAEACSKTAAYVKEQYSKLGDLAEVAQNSKAGQKLLMVPKPLTVARVFTQFKAIALASGKDSQKQRGDKMTSLLREAKGAEVNFLVRALQGKMRIGLAEQSVLMALGYALVFHHTPGFALLPAEQLQVKLAETADAIRRVYHEVPSLNMLVPRLLTDGLEALREGVVSITPGVAVKPMLAHPTNGVTAVFDRFEQRAFTCEYKYDGERAQIHFKRERDGMKSTFVRIFSRNSENNTTKYPDIISTLPEVLTEEVESCILDAEVVAYDKETDTLKSFQELQHRGRKNVDASKISVNVCVFAFDVMFLNGEPLLRRSLRQRREILFNDKYFKPVPQRFQLVQHMNSTVVEDIEEFVQQSCRDGCEGLMVKTLDEDAEYVPSRRTHSWLKIKKDYMDGVVDTLDLVPIGAFFGKGKRTGVFGGFLLACYDKDTESYQCICKIGTGFSDPELEAITEKLRGNVVSTPPPYYRYHEKVAPDVWLTESVVWEVKAADLSVSPIHCAAMGRVADGKGIALRFPRFMREREDKGPVDATDSEQVALMYLSQTQGQQQGGGGNGGGVEVD